MDFSLSEEQQLLKDSVQRFVREEYELETRRKLVARAAREVWAFFVQRELCGLRDQKQVIAFYGIPNEVLVRLGVSDKPHR